MSTRRACARGPYFSRGSRAGAVRDVAPRAAMRDVLRRGYTRSVPDDPDDFVTTVIGGSGGRGATIPLAGVTLTVIDGPDRGARARVSGGVTRVGTAASNALRLTDRAVSRVHCELRLSDRAVQIVDVGSTNGTFLEGVRVHDAELTAGAVFRVGTTSIRVDAADAPMRVPIAERDRFGGLLGGSVAMRRVYAVLERIAATDTTALIHGETGTGKELAARAVHEASRRARGPFVTVDCGAIAENLIESELFGHVRGAFSGAHGERRGLFEEAHGGTLFLDEIAELPLALQPKLLRALEAREVRRVGSNTPRAVDVRVLAATHRSLAQGVNDGSFREDLYYRLAVIEVELPPLRARREDIATIAQHFYERFAAADETIPDALLSALNARAWSGNVRELRNFIERSVTLGHAAMRAEPAGAVAQAPVDAEVPVHLPLKDARVAWMDQFERRYVEALLRRTGGNVTRAAALAGVNRRSLQRLIASLGGRVAESIADGDSDD
jgi:DNA-binding NtrC family response regulator